MRVSLKTLRRLVALPKSMIEEQIAQRLSVAGFETTIEQGMWADLDHVLLAKVAQLQEIPDHPKLQQCQLQLGKQHVQVVSAASNIKPGDLVAYVAPNTQLPSGQQIDTKTVGGVSSAGMLCSAADLGLCDSSQGVLLVAPQDVDTTLLGSPLGRTAGLLDTVFDIDVTPNRPDALGHVGIARELSACLQVPMLSNTPRCQEIQASIDTAVHVSVQQREHCPRFACRVIQDIVVQQSPLWLQTLLTDCGVRSINNVVDITNWVMLHRGHPLHAYDASCLSQDRQRAQLVVRMAQANETLQLLDNASLELSTEDLVVADAQQPLGLAGIMGGKASGISATTQSVVLEAAYFNPNTIRRMVQRHRLNTQASHRMERGCDPSVLPLVLDEAAHLLTQLANGRVLKGMMDLYPSKIQRAVISFRPSRFYQLSGIGKQQTDEPTILRLLGGLGVETIGRRGDAICFSAPTFRPDLTREVDLIEELMRLIGYDHVPTAPLVSYLQSESPTQHNPNLLSHYVRRCLVGQGFCEAVHSSLGSASQHDPFCHAAAATPLQLQNPLGEETKALRYSLLPALLDTTSQNLKRGIASPRLFEVGVGFASCEHTPLPPGSMPQPHHRWAQETTWAAAIMAGRATPQTFDRHSHPVDFYDIKGVITHILASLGLWQGWQEQAILFRPLPPQFAQLFHPGLAAALYHHSDSGDTQVGLFGQFHPQICEDYDLKKEIYGFELNLTALQPHAHASQHFVSPPNRYPTMQRDLAVVVPESVTAQQIVDLLQQHNQPNQWVQDIRFFDLYRGPNIAQNHKSLGLSICLRAPNRTLTDEEAATFMTTFITKLQETLKASVRS
ncbi:MAG: phenylalanine--tRNA ligase subunit beta [Myxococcota bacterium]